MSKKKTYNIYLQHDQIVVQVMIQNLWGQPITTKARLTFITSLGKQGSYGRNDLLRPRRSALSEYFQLCILVTSASYTTDLILCCYAYTVTFYSLQKSLASFGFLISSADPKVSSAELMVLLICPSSVVVVRRPSSSVRQLLL